MKVTNLSLFTESSEHSKCRELIRKFEKCHFLSVQVVLSWPFVQFFSHRGPPDDCEYGSPQSFQKFRNSRVQNCTFLVANATKNFALATRISQLVSSGRLTMLFPAMIITQTIALIFSQIDQSKIQSRHQLVTSFLPFRCIGSIKLISFYYKSTTMFYSYEQCKASLPCFFFSGVP